MHLWFWGNILLCSSWGVFRVRWNSFYYEIGLLNLGFVQVLLDYVLLSFRILFYIYFMILNTFNFWYLLIFLWFSLSFVYAHLFLYLLLNNKLFLFYFLLIMSLSYKFFFYLWHFSLREHVQILNYFSWFGTSHFVFTQRRSIVILWYWWLNHRTWSSCIKVT